MREIITTFLLLLILVNSNGQTFVLQDGDSTYQDRVIFDNRDTTNLWEFKPNLPKGQYWVIEPTECGPDTLKYAEFLNLGIKHGTWIEWESKMCIGTYKDRTISDEIESWDFASDKEKYDETVYDSGFLVKTTLYHIGSNQPHWEHFYPPGATKENEWNLFRIWTETGILAWKMSYSEDRYYEQETYHDNGTLEAKGRTNKKDQHIGTWQFWNDSGELIGEVTYKKGKPKRIEMYRNEELPNWAQIE